MRGSLSRRGAAAWLREIGIDFIPRPLLSGGTGRPPAKPAGPAEPVRASGPVAEDPAAASRQGVLASADGGAAGETVEDIRRELAECRRCPLCPGRRTVVFGVGNPRARLLFVGEGPGEEEDRQGEPFVGAAGRRLNQWIARIGLSRPDVYIANIVKCRPPGNRAPLPEEALSCLPFLRRQIRAIRPEVICALGAVALSYLCDTNDRITRVRGTWRDFEGIPVLPTYHPAYILRNPAREREVFADFDLLSERLRRG